MTTLIKKQKVDSAVIALGLTGVLLLLEISLVIAIFSGSRRFGLYWRPFHVGILCFVSFALIATPLSAFVSMTLSAKSRSRIKRVVAAVFLPLTAVLTGGFALFWWVLIWGGGSGQTVAVMASPGIEYKLDYTASGDPPRSAYIMYECKPVNWWCRELGHVYSGQLGFAPVEPAEIELSQDGDLSVKVNGVVVAYYGAGHFRCVESDAFYCLGN